jgi:hypothetical protein
MAVSVGATGFVPPDAPVLAPDDVHVERTLLPFARLDGAETSDHFTIATCWDGVRVTFVKIGNFVTVRCPDLAATAPAVLPRQHRLFKVLVEALELHLHAIALQLDALPPVLQPLLGPDIVTLTCELTAAALGSSLATRKRAAPALHPLYTRTHTGALQLVQGRRLSAQEHWPQAVLAHVGADVEANTRFQTAHALVAAPETGRFLRAGCFVSVCATVPVLYRALVPDLEAAYSPRVAPALVEALRHCNLAAMTSTGALSLQAQLGLGPGAWSLWGLRLQQLVHTLLHPRPPTATALASPSVVVLVGAPGSGKSYFSQLLLAQQKQATRWTIVNQDTLGNVKRCAAAAAAALASGHSVVIDRSNFDCTQRVRWIELAAAAQPVATVIAVHLDVPEWLCRARILRRVGHPTLPPVPESAGILHMFVTTLVPPVLEEGFAAVYTVTDDASLHDTVAALSQTPRRSSTS